MDMLSEMVGTLCFGWCFTQLGAAQALIALTTFAAVGLPLELWLLEKVRRPPRTLLKAGSYVRGL